MNDEYWMFMSADYYATGEGRTICLMMTQAVPCCEEDFEFSENKYVACTTQEYRARRKFVKTFGEFYSKGLDFWTREEFFNKYATHLPESLKLKDQNCFIEYFSEFYFNYS